MAFNREDFSLRSKSELLDYIEQQCDQISRLETRFRGVLGEIVTAISTHYNCMILNSVAKEFTIAFFVIGTLWGMS